MVGLTRHAYLWLAVTSFIGSGSNYASYTYIDDTYDTSLSPFYILRMDSAFAASSSFVGMGSFTYLAVAEDPGPVSCSLMLLTTGTAVVIQAFDGLMLSLIRFKIITLNLPNGWLPEPLLITYSQIGLFLVIAYNIVVQCFNSALDLNMSIPYNVCMHSEEDVNFAPTAILIILPMAAILVASAYMDIRCFLHLRQHQENHVGNAAVHDQVSMRASIISTCSMLLFIISGAILTPLDVSHETKALVVLFLCRLLIIIRNPLISTLAYQVNEVIQRVDAEEDRERRRQFEEQDALRRREERKREKDLEEAKEAEKARDAADAKAKETEEAKEARDSEEVKEALEAEEAKEADMARDTEEEAKGRVPVSYVRNVEAPSMPVVDC